MIKAGEGVIKTDVTGRMRTSAARRESLVDEFERSGLSGAKFAALAGIKYSTFAAWARRRRSLETKAKPAKVSPDPVKWLEAMVEQGPKPDCPNSGTLVLHLPGGVRAEIADAHQALLAAALLRALGQPC
jgi:hypothetical protein